LNGGQIKPATNFFAGSFDIWSAAWWRTRVKRLPKDGCTGGFDNPVNRSGFEVAEVGPDDEFLPFPRRLAATRRTTGEFHSRRVAAIAGSSNRTLASRPLPRRHVVRADRCGNVLWAPNHLRLSFFARFLYSYYNSSVVTVDAPQEHRRYAWLATNPGWGNEPLVSSSMTPIARSVLATAVRPPFRPSAVARLRLRSGSGNNCATYALPSLFQSRLLLGLSPFPRSPLRILTLSRVSLTFLLFSVFYPHRMRCPPRTRREWIA